MSCTVNPCLPSKCSRSGILNPALAFYVHILLGWWILGCVCSTLCWFWGIYCNTKSTIINKMACFMDSELKILFTLKIQCIICYKPSFPSSRPVCLACQAALSLQLPVSTTHQSSKTGDALLCLFLRRHGNTYLYIWNRRKDSQSAFRDNMFSDLSVILFFAVNDHNVQEILSNVT